MRAPRLIILACAWAAALGPVSAGEVQSPVRDNPPAAQSPQPPSGTLGDEAAEKHLRRTACLKDARARKLVGAQRTAFVKNCVETGAEN